MFVRLSRSTLISITSEKAEMTKDALWQKLVMYDKLDRTLKTIPHPQPMV